MQPSSFQSILSALIILLAACVVAGALIMTRSGASAQGSSLMPATPESPAHYAVPAGEGDPSAGLAHYANFAPAPFTITSVGTDSITGTFGSSTQQETITLTPSTELYAQGARKSDAQYQAELADFERRIQYASTNDVYVAPDPYVHVERTKADLTAGLTVTLASAGGDAIFIELP